MAEAEAINESRVYEEDGEHGTSTEYIDPWCDLCYDETGDMIKVYGFCPECNNFICKSCNESHRKLPILQNHKILRDGKMPKSQADKPVKYPVCTTHAGNVKDHYCLDHNKMICNECIKQTHQQCSSDPLSDICKGLSSEDIQQFGTVVNALKQNVVSTKSALENNATDIENDKDDLIKQAQGERDKIISKAGELFVDTVSMISEVCEQKHSHIANQVLTLDNIIHSLDETACDINKQITVKFDQNVFIRMQQIVENTRECKREIENMNKQLHKITLSLNTSSDVSIFLSVSKHLGDVKEELSQFENLHPLPETVFPQTSALTIKKKAVKKEMDISQISTNKSAPLNIRTTQDKQVSCTQGIDVTSKGMLLLTDRQNKSMKVFSKFNKLISCLPLTGGLRVIRIINDTTAAVSTDDSKLHILDMSDPGSISIKRSMTLQNVVVGISLYKGNLVVTTLSEPRCVKMIDLNGKELWSISASQNGERLFETPRSIASNDMTIIVTDWGKHTITLLDPNDGHHVKTIDVTRKHPLGVTTDKDGNVYVCYRATKEICVFSSDFEQNRILLSGSDLQERPYDIVYNYTTGILYISYFDNDTVDCFQLS